MTTRATMLATTRAATLAIAGVMLASGVATAQQSGTASNISPLDTRSVIAPTLPTPAAGNDNNPHAFLLSARQALAAGRTGAAQEALERAETRLLDRPVPRGTEGAMSRGPRVEQIRSALAMLSANNRPAAMQIIDQLLAETPGPAAGPPPRVAGPGYSTPGYPAPAYPAPGYPAAGYPPAPPPGYRPGAYPAYPPPPPGYARPYPPGYPAPAAVPPGYVPQPVPAPPPVGSPGQGY